METSSPSTAAPLDAIPIEPAPAPRPRPQPPYYPPQGWTPPRYPANGPTFPPSPTLSTPEIPLELIAPARADEPPIAAPLRTLLAAALLAALADATIYRGRGFAGYGLLFLLAPLLVTIGVYRRRFGFRVLLLAGLLLAVSAKLVWNGSAASVALGFCSTIAFAMAIAGMRPIVPRAALYLTLLLPSGCLGVFDYLRKLHTPRGWRVSLNWLAVLLPLAALLVFGRIFLLANPDLLESLRRAFDAAWTAVADWLAAYSISFGEFVFLGFAAIASLGLMRPLWRRYFERSSATGAADETLEKTPPSIAREGSAASDMLYIAARNTLASVIGLFAVYLAFEFATLWFREFPKGFYYSGYAHQGAAWLTVALALATAMLSVVFRGGLTRHARVGRLRTLAWIWSAENILLAIAVYHRLFIYVGFNGMTRMRIVGLFGISAVVAGFLLVLWKIARQRDFAWLLRCHAAAVSLACALFILTPIDAIAMRYNVARIRAGDSAPAVQISVHPIDAEGYLLLPGALDSPDPLVREGVKAMLAARLDECEQRAADRVDRGWTAHQIAEKQLLDTLRARKSNWSEYTDDEIRKDTRKRFDEYVYRWY